MRNLLLAALLLTACSRGELGQAETTVTTKRDRVEAAERLATIYSASKLALWDVDARAVKEDCSVLLIHVRAPLDPATAERLQFGDDILKGGAASFARNHGFRGTVWLDSLAIPYTFGSVTADEIERATVCR